MAKPNGNTNGHKLSARRQLFVEAYLGRARGNGAEAARLAGYRGDSNTLKVTASRMLTDANVASIVAKRLEPVIAWMGADAVLNELTELASVSVEPKEVGAAGKLRALELLGKYHKLFVDRVERSTEENETERAKADALTSVAASLEKMAARKQAPA